MQSNNQAPAQAVVQERKLADAVAGNYDFSTKAIIDEAWDRTKGFKTTYWGAMALWGLTAVAILAAVIVLGSIIGILLGGSIDTEHEFTTISGLIHSPMLPIFASMMVLFIIAAPFLLSLNAGIWMIGIYYAAFKPSKATMLFQYFSSKFKLFSAWVFVWMLSMIADFFTHAPKRIHAEASTMGMFVGGFALLLGLVLYAYVSVSYSLYKPLIVEKNLRFWQALEVSRQAIGHRWVKVAAVLSIVALVLMLPAIIIISLCTTLHWFFAILALVFIWLAPFGLLSLSIMYREIFGVGDAEKVTT